MSSRPDDLHDLIAFEDPDEYRTWVFDATFLTSSWRCLYGDGCPGVLTEESPELEHGCCSYGAHFVDDDDVADVAARIATLTADQWQLKGVAERKGGPTKTAKDGTVTTRTHQGACIMLNRPDFPGGAGCALHRAALEAGERPMDWKPDVCWQLPLRLDEHTDAYGYVTSHLREWKRRDWGAGGAEFHWWCTDDDLAFDGHRPVYEELADEITEMVGPTVYALLVDELERRDRGTPVAHPTLRRD